MTTSDPALYEPFFRPITIGALSLPNRIAMAPMTRRKVPEERRAVPTDEMIQYYARRAAGGTGLIITEGTVIDDRHAPDTRTVPGIWSDAQVEAWSRVTAAVHHAGDRSTKIALQLWHTGRHGMHPIGPSPVAAPNRAGGYKPTPREMSERDITDVIDAFRHGAENARRAGFDAVEIHGAHGYLLESFLSPASNKRNDRFGGPFENRMRFPLMVCRAVRAALGDEYPIIYRFSQWKVEDASAINFPDPRTLGLFVTALREEGINLLHASTADATEAAFEGSPKTLAGWARELGALPVIAVGRVSVSSSMSDAAPVEITDPAPAAALIDRNEADLIAVGRALIANPDWPKVVREGRWQELKPYTRAMLETLE